MRAERSAQLMDPFTHTLLGSATGYAAFGKPLGRMAALAGALAGALPDADVFIYSATDPLVAIEYHRHFTHALLFAPLGAAFVTAFGLWHHAWRVKTGLIWSCCLAAYVSHCLLDAATSYGSQLWWPLSRTRVGWDFISIIDPLFTLVLLTGLIWALIVKRQRPAQLALGVVAGYMLLGAIQHARAVRAQQRLASARGHEIERREVMPTLGNNLVWRALYEHKGQVHSDRIRVGWLSSPTVAEGWGLPLISKNALTDAELRRNMNQSFERFHWFSEGWVARSPEDDTVLGDMRYSLSAKAFDPIWGIRFAGPDSSADVEWVSRTRDRRIEPSELWIEIFGGDERYQPLPPVRSR